LQIVYKRLSGRETTLHFIGNKISEYLFYKQIYFEQKTKIKNLLKFNAFNTD